MQFNDLAIASGRAQQSKETGLLHHYYGKTEAPHQAIPIFENMLFALALCRTKTVEGVQEGKGLLDKLLAYQQPDGLFPIYLHEFPACFDRYIGAELLPPLYWLYHCFHTVLGETAERLQKAIAKLLVASLKEIGRMPLHQRLKVAGAAVSCGKQWGNEEWISLGQSILATWDELLVSSKFMPVHLAEGLTGLLLGHTSAEKLIHWMRQMWHPQLQCYVGPFKEMHFNEGQQELTLFDLYMGAITGQLTPRAKILCPLLLQGALIFPGLENSSAHDEPIGKYWNAACLPEAKYPFVFQWGKAEDVRSFILDPVKSRIHIVQDENSFIVEADLGTLPPIESREETRELSWYLSPGLRVLVNGQPATTFRAQDLLTIEDEEMRIELSFLPKEGIFQGHLVKGCHPTELRNFGQNRYAAYQWQLFFRTISRPEQCKIPMHFRYAPKN